MCKVKCQDCALWASDKVCQYCDHYAYFRDAYRCDIDDKESVHTIIVIVLKVKIERKVIEVFQ